MAYTKMTNKFPTEERYGLTSQMRRSAVSIPSNIAEGSSRSSDKDFSWFVEISYGSLMGNVSEAFIARNQTFMSTEDFAKLYADAEKLAKMLSGLRNSLTRP